MKKQILTILILLFLSVKAIACSCDTPKPVLEFYSSKYVFKGVITKKTFSKDSATYNIKFKVLESYKNGKIPKEISFTSYYQKKGSWDSCYREAYLNQEWLVFVKEKGGKLYFSQICTNSQLLNNKGIDANMQKLLNNANNFKLQDYIYNDYDDERTEFNYPKPITNLDSIFKTGKIKDYEKTYMVLALYIDEKGKLISSFSGLDMHYSEPYFVYHPVFKLLKKIDVRSKRPLNDFEIEAMDLYSKVDWEVKRHKDTKIPVKYIRYVRAEFDKETKKWKHDI
ncbi:hypothetical protein BB050_02691 [Flavobacterium anhuiense]|uniref:Lipoprotein n=1 Tax=Flavobacterium anhuiense TaxID=459526 RepID=A0AAC9D335_9FLAO|nr:hypothetical protein [Flavobacterium anhuiense]AOC95786.1 hypothetical protein BB050_02691 [Flavobacterium anhuiense]